jgi:quinol monooxygenase YgiN
MIIVKGTIPLSREDREEAVALIREMADSSRRESGCLAYEVYLSVEDPDTVVLWQQWSSLEALEHHFASDHVDAFLDVIPDYIDGQVISERFEVRAETSDETGGDVRDERAQQSRVQVADNTVVH